MGEGNDINTSQQLQKVLQENVKGVNLFDVEGTNIDTVSNEIDFTKVKAFPLEKRQECYASKYATKQIFTKEQESILEQYLVDSANLHYGVTYEQIRELAYEFAKMNNVRRPAQWDKKKLLDQSGSKVLRSAILENLKTLALFANTFSVRTL